MPLTMSNDPYVLVVDDLPDNLYFLQFLLESEGYNVQIADNGYFALAKVEAAPPALVMLDVMMPELNGLEVTRLIRQNSGLPPFPILLVTADRSVQLTDALGIGADGLIHKPLDISEVLANVKKHWKGDEETSFCPPAGPTAAS